MEIFFDILEETNPSITHSRRSAVAVAPHAALRMVAELACAHAKQIAFATHTHTTQLSKRIAVWKPASDSMQARVATHTSGQLELGCARSKYSDGIIQAFDYAEV